MKDIQITLLETSFLSSPRILLCVGMSSESIHKINGNVIAVGCTTEVYLVQGLLSEKLLDILPQVGFTI